MAFTVERALGFDESIEFRQTHADAKAVTTSKALHVVEACISRKLPF